MTVLLAAMAALGATVACGGSDAEPGPGATGADTSAGRAGEASAERVPASDSARIDWSRADTVNVRITEYRIQMPRTLPPGPTVFHVTNAGAVKHNFEIEGEGPTGINEAFGRNLRPTQTRDLNAVLDPGKFKLFCSVGAHARRGEILILDVPAGESGAADSTRESSG